jgi:hypothetical protein
VSGYSRGEAIEVFRARYLFALFPGGGIAVDPASGKYWALNRTAAAVCQFISAGRSWSDVHAAVAARWGLSSDEAGSAIDRTCQSLENVDEQVPALWEHLPYQRFETGHALVLGRQPLIAVTREADHLHLLASPEEFPVSIEQGLRIISPKILAAHGRVVLHAATCRFGGALAAFCGPSGAGKSTTASTFHTHGVPKLADEILPISISNGSVSADPGAEKRVYEWCKQGARELAANPRGALDCRGLVEAAEILESLPLGRFLFLSAQMRGGAYFDAWAVPAWEALGDVLSQMFLGRQESPHLRRFLANCHELAALVPAERVRVPSGLTELADAVQTYIVKTTS